MSVTISYPSTQFEELYGPFVNLGAHLPLKDNSLIILSVSFTIFVLDRDDDDNNNNIYILQIVLNLLCIPLVSLSFLI